LIKEVSVCHHFAANKESEQLKAMILDHDGKPIYCLDARFCWRDYETGDYDFSGTLDCRLYALTGSSFYTTLLQNTVGATRDWQTYGRFTREELIGLVGADASRSIVQRCRVRGMIIEIEVFNVKEQKEDGSIASCDMIFTTRNAPHGEQKMSANARKLAVSRTDGE
jgi:hypothetical protein